MNIYDTLFFPDTNIFTASHYPLLLFFTPLHFLRLIENEAGGNSESDLFLRRGLCRADTPAPLGENRTQFLRLIDGIGKRREYYLAQLAIFSDSSTKKNEMVSALLQEFGVRHQSTETELDLWRARMVLALAEMLDRDEEDVREEYSEQLDFFKEEIAALRSLQGAGGTDEVDLLNKLENIMAELEEPRLRDSVNRVESWLLILKNHPLPSVKVWVAASRDCGDRIFTRYEAMSKTSAVPVLKLALPAYIEASGKYVIECIEKFQEDTSAVHRGLVMDFDRLVKTIPYLRDSHESLLPYGIDWAEQWEGKLDEHFPAARYGRTHLIFYLLPGQPLARLLSVPESSGASHDQAAHGLLGILGPH